ncbi:hypothetical protein ACIO1C_14930 [Streptomyces sp. NPDC087420]|uniref:hypothetical protein n=1 Tax=Streptomyces sp. NPDC087420 TaxID=3365785 RepID=UPI0038354B0B
MGADPGRLPTPAASPSAPAGRGADEEAAAAPRPGASPDGAATAPVQPSTTSGTAEAEAAAGAATGAAATRQQSGPEASAGTGRRTQAARTGSAASATVPDASASASASAAASGEASGEGAGRGDGEPPSGNPKKPLLAAAGLAGVILLAVPLLIWATDDSDKKTDKTSVVAESDTILDDQALNAPPGDYAPASPTAKPTTAKPSVKAKAKAKTPAEPLSPPPLPSPTAEKSAAATKAPKKKAVVKAKPPANTASLAVMKLATQNAGRHICYRAYVKGIGWQAPVCDGAEAGTQGQNRPITALNIAVSSTNGVNATPWTMGEGYKAPWKGAADGGDLYIGVASSSAPALGGFGINIGQPLVCVNAFVTDRAWLGLRCDNPGGENLIFAGTLEKTLALQAIRLTV